LHTAVLRCPDWWVLFILYKDVMSSITLRIAGSIHQGNEGFSEKSRGRQCAFMSYGHLSKKDNGHFLNQFRYKNSTKTLPKTDTNRMLIKANDRKQTDHA